MKKIEESDGQLMSFDKLNRLAKEIEEIRNLSPRKRGPKSMQKELWVEDQTNKEGSWKNNTMLANKWLSKNSTTLTEIDKLKRSNLSVPKIYAKGIVDNIKYSITINRKSHYEYELTDKLKSDIEFHRSSSGLKKVFSINFLGKPSLIKVLSNIENYLVDKKSNEILENKNKIKNLDGKLEPLSESEINSEYEKAEKLTTILADKEKILSDSISKWDYSSLADLNNKVDEGSISIKDLKAYASYVSGVYKEEYMNADYADNRIQAREEKEALEPLRKRSEELNKMVTNISRSNSKTLNNNKNMSKGM